MKKVSLRRVANNCNIARSMNFYCMAYDWRDINASWWQRRKFKKYLRKNYARVDKVPFGVIVYF